MREKPARFERRDDVDMITQVLSALEEKGTLTRFRLMYFVEDTTAHFTPMLNRIWAHNLVSVDHRGVTITKKGRKALQIYRGLVDMIKCE